MKRNFFYLTLIALLLIPIASQAAVYNFTPTQDATIKLQSPATNFNSPVPPNSTYPREDSVGLSANKLQAMEALLTFDLSSIPNNETITGVILKLYITSATGSFTTDLYETATGWSETAVTWNTKPVVGNAVGSTTSPASTGWFNISLTASEFDNVLSSLILIRNNDTGLTNSDKNNFKFFSKDNNTLQTDPRYFEQLEVTTRVPEPSFVILLGISMLGLGVTARRKLLK
jgi:hypothetical protein